jgi:hypothetical protein
MLHIQEAHAGGWSRGGSEGSTSIRVACNARLNCNARREIDVVVGSWRVIWWCEAAGSVGAAIGTWHDTLWGGQGSE